MMKLNEINDAPIVAILRHLSPSTAVDVMNVLIDSGIKIIEVPLNSQDAILSIEKMSNSINNEAIVGAGTVISESQVEAVHNAGGRIIVSPNYNPNVIQKTKLLNMVSMPGCGTSSEIFNALEAGADAIKLFPAETLPPSWVKAMNVVLPQNTQCFVVGGVSEKNMGQYMKAGAFGFGIGSSLYKPGMSLAEIKNNATRIMTAYRKAKSEMSQ
ncbi:2-dehydro-3-deoxy-6-phosphogalactonate aldolase [Aliikangiella coralliicola]|uniref:2-dehydro-3-deoxy-6-phosphogalactonate aldolase n=1 Tax=Aliikangiella coralliicola TaxID=2592383 RepID=A0A545UID1_9GAMM|nr:2-dehydro-3-deoxy-6-phosphogalactonate aldolase [Aliikangiella coralliicola]TQV89224.1 2-dehydro-3-deoxy-6-phosphogalactonate aldolase [Aliikangiella coralliicola]